jgi:hypothetical protein
MRFPALRQHGEGRRRDQGSLAAAPHALGHSPPPEAGRIRTLAHKNVAAGTAAEPIQPMSVGKPIPVKED